MRISNQGIDIPGSIQVTDEYPCSDVFPNSFDANNYLEWCELESKRIGFGCFVYEDIVLNDDGVVVPVCHIRRRVDG